MLFHIINTLSGHSLGDYEGDSALEAYQSMMRDSGYPDSASAEEAGFSWTTPPVGILVVEVDDFAMLTPPTRPGPCKAATAPEQDPTERRLEREREAARFIVTDLPCIDGSGTKAKVSVEALGGGTFRLQIRDAATFDRFMAGMGVEVKHGSGKVKV